MLLKAAQALTTPLLPDDYLTYLNPLWSTREPRGRIDAVIPETADSATLWIKPSPGWPRHTAGQYVRVGVDIEGVRHWRTYSFTSTPDRSDGRFAITVKAIPDGFVSQHLVHETMPGTIVRLAAPAGEFVLPSPVPDRLLFVTAGSGITPVMGMLRDLEARGATPDVVHVHVAPTADEAIFGAELRRLDHRLPNYVLHEHHDAGGEFFTVDRLDELVPDCRDRQAWACGPAGLLDALDAHLEHLNVERFRPVVAAFEGEGGIVTFTESQRTVEIDGATPLLVAGEEAGALLANGCRMGICHTCVGRLRSGAVRDLRTGEVCDTEGELVRICVSGAAGPAEIEL